MAMWLPSYADFDSVYAGRPGVGYYYAPQIHPDPQLRKYTFRVWTRDATWEGATFFLDAPIHSLAWFRVLEQRLVAGGEHYFVYGIQRPRLGSAVEHQFPTWPRMIFAPTFDDDADPEWNVFK